MSVSIYLNNQQVQIVVGTRGRKGVYQDSYILDAPEGSIINGIVTDTSSFIEFLKETWSRYRLSKTDVHLVVGGNKIHGRNLEVPILSPAKTKEYLSRELSDMEKDGEEYVVCYNSLSGKAGKKLRNFYVEMAEKELIKDYVDIFKEAGITLKSLVSAEGSILSLLDKTVNGYFKTFILQIMNGNLVTNILWVDGSFNYYNTVRCFNDVGTGAYYDDCARSLSNLNQFIQAHKIEQKIEKILTQILSVFHLIKRTVNGDRHRTSFLRNNDSDRVADLTCADGGSVSGTVTFDHMESLRERNVASGGNDPAVTDQKRSIMHRRSLVKDRLKHGVGYRRIKPDDVFLLEKFAEFRRSFQKHDRAGIGLAHLSAGTDDLIDHVHIAQLIFGIIVDDRTLEGREGF